MAQSLDYEQALVLERLRLRGGRLIPRALLENTEIKSVLEAQTDQLLLELRSEVLCEHRTLHYKLPEAYPASRWQHLKKALLPRFLLARFPVKHKLVQREVVIHMRELWPEMHVPDQMGRPTLQYVAPPDLG